MKIRILGCGGSFGSPLAWNKNGNIDVNNIKNFRTRSSLLIYHNSNCILIDTSPDLRQQLYNAKCQKSETIHCCKLRVWTNRKPIMRIRLWVCSLEGVWNFELY